MSREALGDAWRRSESKTSPNNVFLREINRRFWEQVEDGVRGVPPEWSPVKW